MNDPQRPEGEPIEGTPKTTRDGNPDARLGLRDIVDRAAIESMMDDFFRMTRMPTAVLDRDGEVLVGVGWQDICTRFHRVHPETCRHCRESDTVLTDGVPEGEFRRYRCRNNLWDVATPIVVDGRHLGNLFTGQFFFDDEVVDREGFRAQAIRYGFDPAAYLAALDAVPRLSRETVDAGMSFLLKMARMVSMLGRSNLALRESQRDLNRAQAVAHTGSWRLDLRGNCLRWSDETCRIFGEPPGTSLTYEEFLARIHPDDRARVDREWAAALRGEPYDCEHRIVVDGEVKWVRERAELDFAPGGELVAGFGTVQDVTERKRSEEAVYRHREWLRVTLSSIGDAVLTTDTAGRVTFLNPIAAELTGWTTTEAEGRPAGEVFRIVDEQTGLPANDVIGRVLRDGRIVTLANHTALVTRDGRKVPIEDSAAPIRDIEGTLAGVVLVFHDVTAQRKARDELDASQARLRELNETLEHRVAERTAEVQAQAERLRYMGGQLAEAEQRERTRLARLLHDHLQQVLVAAKMQAGMVARRIGGEPCDPEVGRLEALIDESIETSRSLTRKLNPLVLHDRGLLPALEWLARWMDEKHRLKVQVDAAPDAEPGDEAIRSTLFEATRELLLNVVKHAATGTARVEASREGSQVRIVVSDEGSGFPADPAGQAATTTGLGLFGMRQRLEYLGGTVDVRSSPGRGCRVRISVPTAALEAPDRAVSSVAATASTSPGASAASVRILLADDHAILRQGLATLLRLEPGLEVVGEACNGREAVELAGRLRPDIVVMDLSMPVMDGLEATRILRDQCPASRVIGLSLYDAGDMAQAMVEAGAVAYLPKGGPADVLVRTIREHAPSRAKGGN